MKTELDNPALKIAYKAYADTYTDICQQAESIEECENISVRAAIHAYFEAMTVNVGEGE